MVYKNDIAFGSWTVSFFFCVQGKHNVIGLFREMVLQFDVDGTKEPEPLNDALGRVRPGPFWSLPGLGFC